MKNEAMKQTRIMTSTEEMFDTCWRTIWISATNFYILFVQSALYDALW